MHTPDNTSSSAFWPIIVIRTKSATNSLRIPRPWFNDHDDDTQCCDDTSRELGLCLVRWFLDKKKRKKKAFSILFLCCNNTIAQPAESCTVRVHLTEGRRQLFADSYTFTCYFYQTGKIKLNVKAKIIVSKNARRNKKPNRSVDVWLLWSFALIARPARRRHFSTETRRYTHAFHRCAACTFRVPRLCTSSIGPLPWREYYGWRCFATTTAICVPVVFAARFSVRRINDIM